MLTDVIAAYPVLGVVFGPPVSPSRLLYPADTQELTQRQHFPLMRPLLAYLNPFPSIFLPHPSHLSTSQLLHIFNTYFLDERPTSQFSP